METVLIAAIVALSTMTGPLLLAHYTNKQRRREKIEDYERQDAVADQAAKAARLLLASNERVAADTRQTNRKLDAVSGDVKVIHMLVNSNMTAAKQAELAATERELAMMKVILAMNAAAGKVEDPDAVAAINSTEESISKLRAELEDRLRQQTIINEEQKTHIEHEEAGRG